MPKPSSIRLVVSIKYRVVMDRADNHVDSCFVLRSLRRVNILEDTAGHMTTAHTALAQRPTAKIAGQINTQLQRDDARQTLTQHPTPSSPMVHTDSVSLSSSAPLLQPESDSGHSQHSTETRTSNQPHTVTGPMDKRDAVLLPTKRHASRSGSEIGSESVSRSRSRLRP